jgi:3D (Asp-Asp-Asp) domain-containing protein
LTNPKRFVIFILVIIFVVINICAIVHINNITTTKMDRNLEIQEEIKSVIMTEVKASEIETETILVSSEFIEKEPELTSLGSFTVTAYCCCKTCCGKEATHPAYGITASGTKATEGRTIAVDPNIVSLGTTVYLNGIPYVAEDTGSAIKGKKIDLFINDHQRAKEFGVQEMEVKI